VYNEPYQFGDVTVLTTDAFGGYGGIAKYNRDLLTAMSTYEGIDNVVVFPRILTSDPGVIPPRIDFVTDSIGGSVNYVRTVARRALTNRRSPLVVCGHIHLLPIAVALKQRYGAHLTLMAYGIEVWKKPRVSLVQHLLQSVDSVVSISHTTLWRFQRWGNIGHVNSHILPNAVELGASLHAGPKDEGLVAEMRLERRTVLMNFGRLESRERYKGFDEVIELLPRLLSKNPNVVFVIAGDGSDRKRLEAKAEALGVGCAVRFTGMLPEERKGDYLRLADAFVMPSRGEGFGFVLLEAMACGIPCVASSLDGGREAVRDGALGVLVDPGDKDDLERGIWNALGRPRGVPAGLEYFEFRRFEERVHRLLRTMLS
jgi:phosphatidyl-myo-inositol dimannoside synthase